MGYLTAVDQPSVYANANYGHYAATAQNGTIEEEREATNGTRHSARMNSQDSWRNSALFGVYRR